MKVTLTCSLNLLLLTLDASVAFQTASFGRHKNQNYPKATIVFSSTADEFASFAASLEEEDANEEERGGRGLATKNKSWQEDLEELMDPLTPLARRQILLSDLMSANEDIQASVQAALRDRKIDPLLTPTGKKLQAGTRAVARQLASDILPSLAQRQSSAPFPSFLPPPPQPEQIQKVGTRIFNAFQKQVQTNLENLQADLQDPTTRIPQRLSQQTEDILQEASNVFAETPVGLRGPPYVKVAETPDYEIRDYPGYKVASTTMNDEGYNADDLASNGAAFNSLAAYLFGANQQAAVMEMTTPVMTTMAGDMRFYLLPNSNNKNCIIPEPLAQDESNNLYETGTIRIQDIPPARLAVRRFTGFVTQGEIARQKEALLAALQLEEEELDVPHGQTVGHLVFQYNPPYSLPVLRRNEIAVPIRSNTAEQTAIAENWVE